MYTKKQIRSRRNRTRQVMIPGVDKKHGRKENKKGTIMDFIRGMFK